MDSRLIERYVDALTAGDAFPPVVVFRDVSDSWLADGFHRVEAACRLGNKTIEAEIHKGGERDAILFAVGANAAHGQNRTGEDKRRAVDMLLSDHEWSTWTDREIARQCRVAQSFVTTRRDRLINSVVVEPRAKVKGKPKKSITETAYLHPADSNVRALRQALDGICNMPMGAADFLAKFGGKAVDVERVRFAAAWLKDLSDAMF